MKKILFLLLSAPLFAGAQKAIPIAYSSSGSASGTWAAPCHEKVDYTVSYQSEAHGVLNGNTLSLRVHTAEVYTGVSESGAPYSGRSESTNGGTFQLDGNGELTVTLNLVLTSPGKGNNIRVHSLYRYRVGKDGALTMNEATYTEECQ